VVAVVGAGPIGLSAMMGARLFSPSHVVAIDLADSRLEAAKQFGADVTIKAVGVPSTFELAAELARPGGHIANIGVHGEPVMLHLEELWIRDVTITTGLVDTYSTPTLLRLTRGHQIEAGRFVTPPPLQPRPVRGGLRRVRPSWRQHQGRSGWVLGLWPPDP
jgi:alcohol dehydrogenase